MYSSPFCECGMKLEAVVEYSSVRHFTIDNKGKLLKNSNADDSIKHKTMLRCPHCWKTYSCSFDTTNRPWRKKDYEPTSV